MNDEKTKKVMTKVLSNFQELSEEERKKWVREASQAILESLRDAPTRDKTDS